MSDRKAIIHRLEKLLEYTAGIRFLVNPQNFFVFDNPDILVTYGTRIWGIYIPTQFEKSNLDSLYRRIYLSRLVYAHDMRIVLVADNYEMFQNSSLIEYTVHKLIVSNDIDQIISVVEHDNSCKCSMLSRNVRKHAANNFYQYETILSKIQYSFGQTYETLHRIDWACASGVTKWSNHAKYILKDAFETDEAIIFNRKKNKTSIKQSIDSILNYTLYRQYRYTDGKLDINHNEKKIRILNTDMFSPLNINSIGVSTLLYLGILPVSIVNTSQFDSVFSKLLKKTI